MYPGTLVCVRPPVSRASQRPLAETDSETQRTVQAPPWEGFVSRARMHPSRRLGYDGRYSAVYTLTAIYWLGLLLYPPPPAVIGPKPQNNTDNSAKHFSFRTDTGIRRNCAGTCKTMQFSAAIIPVSFQSAKGRMASV